MSKQTRERYLLKNRIIKVLTDNCLETEHRGCQCSIPDSKECWGDVADEIIKVVPTPWYINLKEKTHGSRT